jgi:acetate---CoA ligase (ADP-forming) subunit alpha
MGELEKNPLYKMMHPRSVAFWGASNNPMGMGSVQLSQLLALGFEGPVYPVHPEDKGILGLQSYSRVKDIPGPVDLAVLVVPTRVVPEILEECGQNRIKCAIVVSAGFGEKGETGRELQEEITAIAKKHGITLLGPNCIGVVNPHHKLNTTFYPYDAKAGFIGMASQSGSFVTQMFVHLEKMGIGFSQAFSVGNEALTDITDCIKYLGDCPDTKVIGLYIEAIRRGKEFVRVAGEVSKKKPIVAYYVGGSSAGGRAGLSHTGAMAGPDELYNGIFQQAGVTRASTIEELFDYCYVLGSQPLPHGNRIAVLTHSGGPGAAAADAAERSGLVLSDFTPKTVDALKGLVPGTASIKNPVDLTFFRNYNDYMETMPRILLEDDQVDLLFIYCLMPHNRVVSAVINSLAKDVDNPAAIAEAFIRSQCDTIMETCAKASKPAAGGTFCDRKELFVRELQDRGFPCLASPERAVRALGALAKYARARQRLLDQDDQ